MESIEAIVFVNISHPDYVSVLNTFPSGPLNRADLDSLEHVQTILGIPGMPYILCPNPTSETRELEINGWEKRAFVGS